MAIFESGKDRDSTIFLVGLLFGFLFNQAAATFVSTYGASAFCTEVTRLYGFAFGAMVMFFFQEGGERRFSAKYRGGQMNSDFVAALRNLRDAIDVVIEKAEGLSVDKTGAGAVVGAPPAITKPYWIDKAREFSNLHEIDDNDKLEAFLHVDPELTPWCCAFLNSVFTAVGLKGVDSLRARDYAGWGEETEKKDGAVAVFKSHVGLVVGSKLLGGNQGNMVKESNLAWYHKNMDFLGYRWPVV